MSGAFFDSFNPALLDMEAQFGETWILEGKTEYPAIAIEPLEYETTVMKGGQLLNATTRIIIREEVFLASGVDFGSYVKARGIDLSVIRIDTDGDAARTLICGPKGINVWR